MACRHRCTTTAGAATVSALVAWSTPTTREAGSTGATQRDALGKGLQVGVLANYAGNYSGVQVSSLVNGIEHDLEGVQVGFANYADSVRGVQIGVFNITRKLHGVQIGAINIAYKNKLPFMVLVNAGF